MAVTSYATMLTYFLMDLPGVSDPLAKQALSMAGRKFCLDTEVYKKTLTAINVVADTQTYDLSGLLPATTTIKRLDDVRYGTSATDDTTAPYDTEEYSLVDDATFKFKYAPDTSITSGLVVNVILIPTVGSTALESNFFNKWYEGIASYAKYYLLKMDKNKPWYDLERATMVEREYFDYVSRAKREQYVQQKNGSIHIQRVPGRF